MTNSPVLRRDPRRRVLAGVCGALARHWGVDPLLVRVGLIVAAVVTNGIAVLAYLALWIVIPLDSGRPAVTRGTLIRVGVALGVLVIGGGLLVPDSEGATIGVALLAAFGLLWYVVARTQRRPVASTTPGVNSWPTPPAGVLGAPTAPSPGPWGATAAAWPRAPRPHPWRFVLIGTALAWTALGISDAAGANFGEQAYAAGALAVVGLALAWNARGSRAVYGRPRGLVAVGLVLALGTLASALPDTQASAPQPPRLAYTATSLPTQVNLGSGTHTVDLSGLVLESDRTVDVTQEAGRLTVLLPKHTTTRVVGKLGMGQLTTPTVDQSGLDAAFDEFYAASGNAVLTVRVTMDMGQLEVRR